MKYGSCLIMGSCRSLLLNIFSMLLLVSAARVTWAEEATPTNEAERVPDLVIDNFDKGLSHGVYTGRKTTIGAYQGTWAKRPSYSLLRKSELHRRGDSGKGAILEWKKEGGWCGYYTLLQDEKGNPADATPYNALCFWIKGEKGGETFDVGMADSQMQELEIDAVYAGAVNNFIPGGRITTEWQEVKIPLSRLESWLNLASLGSMVFWFREGGSGTIYMDDIALKNDPDIKKFEEYNAARAERDPQHPRALWVWKIDPVNNKKARADLYDLCQRCAIERIFQFFGEFNEKDEPEYVAELEEFIKGCHERGIHVEGLTGNPVWSLRENHDATLKWIRQFLDYNKSRPEELRFSGVSLDVEPYLTGEWNVDKAGIKVQYLELLGKCRKLIDSYGQKFDIGAAIPMAYEQEEKADGFLTKILEQLDYVALMAYYDNPKKVIDASVFHIDLAGKLGRKVWLGAEIQDLVTMKQGNRGNTFWEEGWVEMENVLQTVQKHFENSPGYGGLGMHCFYAYKILQRDRNVPRKDRLPPEQAKAFTLACPKTSSPLTIDGKLDDWDLSAPYTMATKDDVSYGRGAWTGVDDFSVKCYAMWDIENLYFAFQVTDDAVVQEKTGGDMWEGDHIEFWLDVDLLGDYTEAANSSDDFQFGFSPGNFKNVKPEVFIWTPFLEDPYQDVVKIAATRTDKGWVLEVGVPQEFLLKPLQKKPPSADSAESQPDAEKPSVAAPPENEDLPKFEEGVRLGLCIDPSDCDNPDVPQKLLMSTAGENRIWGDPTTFGFLLLKGEGSHAKAP